MILASFKKYSKADCINKENYLLIEYALNKSVSLKDPKGGKERFLRNSLEEYKS